MSLLDDDFELQADKTIEQLEINPFVRPSILENPKQYQKLLPKIIKAKTLIDEAMQAAGLEYKYSFGNTVKLSVLCNTSPSRDKDYATIECAYSRLEKSLGSIIDSMYAIQEMYRFINEPSGVISIR